MIVAYVSGHGFGHAVRTAEVLRVLRELEPDLPLTVVGTAPEMLFREALGERVGYRRVACDVGLVQRDALSIDEAGTAAAWRAFGEGLDTLVASEAGWLRQAGARLVLADIPPVAFQAAAAAGIPAVGLGNFSWDWIYRHYAARQPALGEAAERCARAYRSATLLLELPFTGDMSAFPRRERVPLVARRPRVGREEARRRLGLPDARLALVSFGGIGLPALDLGTLAGDGWQLLTAAEWPAASQGVFVVERSDLAALGLGYLDLVAAADVVVTKPGYGIVSDAIGAGTRMVYTERGDFPEYPILVGELPRYLPARHVSNAELREGRLRSALDAVLDEPWPPPPPLDGAAKSAQLLRKLHGAAFP